VNKAIDRGVAWLEARQQPSGAWPGYPNQDSYQVGMTALSGLTLLECGVPPNDKHLQTAARYLREVIPDLNFTYELSLCILFLDRLGEERDADLIRRMALRLIAGQKKSGGWTYRCPIPSEEDERHMLTILQHQQPRAGGIDLRGNKVGKTATAGTDRGSREEAIDAPPTASGGTNPEDGPNLQSNRRPSAAQAPEARDALPRDLRQAPGLQPLANQKPLPDSDVSDNSNTQFAILGVWTARRHGVPMESTLALITRRFRDSQADDGTWAYRFAVPGNSGTPAMTGVGLLGLAVGLGLADANPEKPQTPPRNAAVENGLRALARSIGSPLRAGSPVQAAPKKKRVAPVNNINLYTLWTIERVGVLYNLRTIGGKDWYAWGAELLVDAQTDEGSWDVRGYHRAVATVDTCFALLFLKRANLVQDLTKKLEFGIDTKSLEGAR
jgi:hypothetical protein